MPSTYEVLQDLGKRIAALEAHTGLASKQEETKEIPPGILKFIDSKGYVSVCGMAFIDQQPEKYKAWVRERLSFGDTIHSICVEGETFQVGEGVLCGDLRKTIHHFDFNKRNMWFAYFHTNGVGYAVSTGLSKLPARTAICELPDETLVEFAEWIITALTGKEMDWVSIVEKFKKVKQEAK